MSPGTARSRGVVRSGWLRRHRRDVALVAILALLVLVFSVAAPNFLTGSSLLSTSRRAVEIGIIALGMAVVIGSAGIDLSVGSIVALSSVTMGYSYAAGAPLLIGVAGGIAVAVICGLVNGLFIAGLHLHPLVVTLGTLALYSGLAIGISNAGGYSLFPEEFLYFGQYWIGGTFPAQIVVWMVLVLIMHLAVTRTVWGRHVLALGINKRAALLSSVAASRLTIGIYVLSGLLSGIAALIFTSRVFSARGDAGASFMLLAIAAVFVGGADLRGGTISIVRTTIAVLIIAVIPDGLTLAGVDTNWQFALIGVVMIAAVAINRYLTGRGIPTSDEVSQGEAESAQEDLSRPSTTEGFGERAKPSDKEKERT